MATGTVESIFIAPKAMAPLERISEVLAVPGVGLEGDRYFRKQGTFFKPEPDFELTLIEAEAVEAAVQEYSFELSTAECRRNLVTRGVPLNRMVGREFQIGNIRVRGIRLCEPCSHLQQLTGKDVLNSLLHRGGLRAQILSEGVIREGDSISY